MNTNTKNQLLKQEARKQYGNMDNFAKKLGYSRQYIDNVLNGRNPITKEFRENVNYALRGDYWDTHDSHDLISALTESSSLRQDLLNLTIGVFRDLLENIELTDEIMARVNDDTYQFVKKYKEDK